MAFKVKCKLTAFMGDFEHFPCHFGYQIGDEFIYDGEKFIGRICPELFSSNMLSVISIVRYSGNLHFGYYPWNYSGISRIEPGMKEYDGVGWANVKEPPHGVREEFVRMTFPIPAKRRRTGGFHCGDIRTMAVFRAEPFGLSDKGFDLPFHRRAMSILEKIKAEPGLTAAGILEKFTRWEREDIYPPLGSVNIEIMLEELWVAGYIEILKGKYYPKSTVS